MDILFVLIRVKIALLHNLIPQKTYLFSSKLKKVIEPELKEKADKLKNEGNELMKQEKFKEALEKYKEAIEIDSSNAVYYCNRAAGNSILNL